MQLSWLPEPTDRPVKSLTKELALERLWQSTCRKDSQLEALRLQDLSHSDATSLTRDVLDVLHV